MGLPFGRCVGPLHPSSKTKSPQTTIVHLLKEENDHGYVGGSKLRCSESNLDTATSQVKLFTQKVRRDEERQQLGWCMGSKDVRETSRFGPCVAPLGQGPTTTMTVVLHGGGAIWCIHLPKPQEMEPLETCTAAPVIMLGMNTLKES
ncbi:hypothetical protein mRhiFer1_007979 [Rhinolophus ferrumequinum]|uniref:Uncharacterized protein n=1 Tax=Rhinolophus ferrumequinum TaxID=59479 RepID=A0A7J8AV43_RHIFE|nr:hypothetical protein mRhiFer1_007979 [Rhinolophus ferrumequinum]